MQNLTSPGPAQPVLLPRSISQHRFLNNSLSWRLFWTEIYTYVFAKYSFWESKQNRKESTIYQKSVYTSKEFQTQQLTYVLSILNVMKNWTVRGRLQFARQRFLMKSQVGRGGFILCLTTNSPPVSLKTTKSRAGFPFTALFRCIEKKPVWTLLGIGEADQQLEALAAFSDDLDIVERTYSFAHNHSNHSSWRANTIL